MSSSVAEISACDTETSPAESASLSCTILNKQITQWLAGISVTSLIGMKFISAAGKVTIVKFLIALDIIPYHIYSL